MGLTDSKNAVEVSIYDHKMVKILSPFSLPVVTTMQQKENIGSHACTIRKANNNLNVINPVIPKRTLFISFANTISHNKAMVFLHNIAKPFITIKVLEKISMTEKIKLLTDCGDDTIENYLQSAGINQRDVMIFHVGFYEEKEVINPLISSSIPARKELYVSVDIKASRDHKTVTLQETIEISQLPELGERFRKMIENS
jgi:hypothetical protein